jgi:hypothetical protein
MLPLRFGKGNVDWQARINFDEPRKKRVEKAQRFMSKYGIGSAIVYNHDLARLKPRARINSQFPAK